jgi:CHASE3 domain sensor protein
VLAAVGAAAVLAISRSIASADWVNHTHAVILEVHEIATAIQTGDGAAVTYVQTQNSASRAASRAALADLAEHLAVAKALTRYEPSQHQQILALEALTLARADLDREIIDRDDAAATRALLGPDGGTGTMAEIRRIAFKLNEEEATLLDTRDRAAFRQAATIRWTVWAGVIVDIFLLAGCAWVIADGIRARRVAALALVEANAQLEAKVAERTVDLAAANRKLSTDILERDWANQALEHQVRYNQVIINGVADLTFVLTRAMNISRINPAVIRLTGRDTIELMNQPLASVVRLTEPAGSQGPALVEPMRRALTDGYDLRDQPAEVEDKLGRKIPVILSLFPLRDQDKVIGGVAILHILPSAPTDRKATL